MVNSSPNKRLMRLTTLILLGFIFADILGSTELPLGDSQWNLEYSPGTVDHLTVGSTQNIEVSLTDFFDPEDKVWVEFRAQDESVAKVETPLILLTNEENSTSINVTGRFLGRTEICPVIFQYSALQDENVTYSESLKCLSVVVFRQSGLIDDAFTYTLFALLIVYVNVGACASCCCYYTTWSFNDVVGPVIGFVSRYIVMPFIAWGLSHLLIPSPTLRIGLLVAGCSPGGDAANILTFVLRGNFDLSLRMSSISAFAALVLPVWLLTLGDYIYDDAQLEFPYHALALYYGVLVGLLLTGLLLKCFFPKFSASLTKILKGSALVLVIISFSLAVYTNLDVFEHLNFQILLAGFLLPCIGFILGGGIAKAVCLDWADITAIAIESGAQNTGLSIIALRVFMDKPEADLNTALPLAAGIMSIIVPAILLIILRLCGCFRGLPMRKDYTSI